MFLVTASFCSSKGAAEFIKNPTPVQLQLNYTRRSVSLFLSFTNEVEEHGEVLCTETVLFSASLSTLQVRQKNETRAFQHRRYLEEYLGELQQSQNNHSVLAIRGEMLLQAISTSH